MPDSGNYRKAAITAYREPEATGRRPSLDAGAEEDVPLLRNVASALSDPARAAEVRALLRARFASPKSRSLKELLADAPLHGIDLDRSDDLGREAELNYLIDTNIISEIRKKRRCDRNVAAWYASMEDDEMFLSVLVAGKIRKGIELARRRDR